VSETKKPSAVERIKERSNFLRGTLEQSLADAVTGALSHDDIRVAKFHGLYQQDDRDVRAERAARKLEPAYGTMARIRAPGGVLTSAQWLAIDAIAQRWSGGTIRLTTRQSIQLHRVPKHALKPMLRALRAAGLTTLAACGDVNRNVVCSALPEQSPLHRESFAHALALTAALKPATHAYDEVWLGADSSGASTPDQEPLYGATYLPRKFKVGVAVPPYNDVDVYAQDLGLVTIERDGALAGFNVAVGGGMGMTHGNPRTYPRLAETIGSCTPEQVLHVARHVLGVQRDFGDRSERSHSRLKYTIDDRGIAWFKQELERRLGFGLGEAQPARFTQNGDRLGWVEGDDGLHYLTLLVPAGRVVDGEHRLRTGLNAVAEAHGGELRITANQNLIVAGVAAGRRAAIERCVAEHGIDLHAKATPLRREAISCVALPTCGLAMAEAERYMPELLAKLEAVLARHGLAEHELALRVSGCPNGCSRPYLAEVALVGKAPGRYNLLIGGSRTGERLNKLYRQNIGEAEILSALDALLADYARRRLEGEPFGDFVERIGVVPGAAPKESPQQSPVQKEGSR
jgi:sulfite reductase (NADPH) hemoprotein beta-component